MKIVHAPSAPTGAAFPATFETTPRREFDKLAGFCAEIGAEMPRLIQVDAEADAIPGWCFANVDRAITRRGGRKINGWLAWSTAAYVNFEFHSVVMTANGELIDVTPKVDGETQVLFAPAPAYGPEFDFLKRPANIRRRLYQARSTADRADDLITCYSAKELALQSKRAAAAGMEVRDYVAARLLPDPLEITIDRFLTLAGAAESLFEVGPRGMTCRNDALLFELELRKTDLRRRIEKMWSRLPGRNVGPETATRRVSP